MRLVIVRRRIGTPPTGRSVLGVSSEYGRSRVAQPAARMTAFMAGRRAQCNPHARTGFSYLPRAGVQLSPDRGRERHRGDQFLSPCRHPREPFNTAPAMVQLAVAMELDAVVLFDALSQQRIAGLTAGERAVRVARRAGATRVLVVDRVREPLIAWRG